MKKYGFLFLTTVLLAASVEASAPRPNILYLYADDLGWGYIGANGQDKVLTPHLDALAGAGVNFTRGYGCNVCSPARSSQQTGFHQGHTWTDRNDPDSSKAIRADDLTIADQLSKAGYRSAYYGKWGYGADQTLNNPAINNPQTLPINHGYDEVLAELHHVRAHTFFQPTLWRSNTHDATPTTALVPNAIPNDPTYPDYPAYQDDPTYPSPAYCDDAYAFAALDFVRAQAQTPEPFFCLLAFQIPHTPLGDIVSLPNWFDAYNAVSGASDWDASSQQFAAMVTRMDAHIGNLMAALEDPNNDGDKSDSVLDNTLIVFASDNGGQSGTPKTFFAGNGVLRGAKGSIYEGGIRVPMMMKWPGKLPAGTNSTQVVDVTDMLPTFCELAGVEAPVGIDGVSLAPMITGVGPQRYRDYVIHEAGNNHSIIRGKYKLIGPGGNLYDLEADPSEVTDIAGAHPELVRELQALLIGERVQEANTFANTYHHWTGTNGASASLAEHWSDYDYTNGGTSYLTDSGAPKVSWNAQLVNTGAVPALAVGDAHLEFLGLEIAGNDLTDAAQELRLDPGINLTGRNEIRLSPHSVLTVDNGLVSSLRWLDIQTNATLRGAGEVQGSIYNAGTLAVTVSTSTTIPGPDIIVPGPDITLSNNMEYIRNGGFELGVDTGGGDYSYDTLEDWFTDGPDASKDGAKPSSPYAGTYRGLSHGANPDYPLIQTTAFPFVVGDSYTLSFLHQGFSGWSSGEKAEVRVFYTDDSDQRVDVFYASFAVTQGTWNPSTYSLPAVTDPDASGKALQFLIGPEAGTGYVSFDGVSLLRHGAVTNVPGPEVTVPGPDITLPGHRRMEVKGDYHADASATLDLTLAGSSTPGEDYAQLLVDGDASLDGTLALTVDAAYTPEHGDAFTLLTAHTLAGSFEHSDNVILGSEGTRFLISYTATSVVATVDGVTTNGTPYSWLEFHSIDGGDHEAADLIDHDGDGMKAWEEYIAGTLPNEKTSTLTLDVEPSVNVNEFTLRWPSVSNRTYRIQRATHQVSFLPYAGPIPADPTENELSVPRSEVDQAFFRVTVER